MVRAVPHVDAVTWASWFGGKDPRNPDRFFGSFAVDPASYLAVYDEIALTPPERQAWLEDRQGVIVGDVLARTMGLHVGDRVSLQSPIYPGVWDFHVSGIYRALRRSMDRSSFILRWDYLNDRVPENRRNRIGWMVSHVTRAEDAAPTAQAIDRVFDIEDTQTLSMDEHAMNQSFMGMFSSLLKAMNIISVIILLILMLLLGNTIAMGVRERTNEYGVLRALGFLPRHVAAFILGEAAGLGLLAGVAGVALSFPIVQRGMGRWLEENQGGNFPYFRIEPQTIVISLALATLLGVLAAIVPARQAASMTVTDALRRLD